MFKKVLIANRGAIACRIIRTLRKMGVASVAVYSDPDAGSLHVSEADEAVRIGAGPAAESYLRADVILAVAKQTGAEAIHPGYGFLSESADFATACEDAGIVFVGPTIANIHDFGLKHTARDLARAANVPLAAGTDLLQDAAAALKAAESIGYPVILKATAGGGGIGMRVCEDAAALDAAFEAVSRLATGNFSNGGVFLERFVRKARHIEVQVFGDGRGNVVALGERDCSLQRRNQKVIEETPAPNFPAKTRAALLDASLRLMREAKYRNAGTVEFLYDSERNEFAFLEVNTRLQVEHGVTEQVTGVDLVEWMIRGAAGDYTFLSEWEKNGKAQGASIQARIYAEDPWQDFRPNAGSLNEVSFPADARVETWVEAGVDVSTFYDPMLAKLIVTADTREVAVLSLQSALDETRISGAATNVRWLREVSRSEPFVTGNVATATLRDLPVPAQGIRVISGGPATTIQDYPGRIGYWDVGVPPSGPMDALSFRLGNRLLGNPEGAAGLEITGIGPTLRFEQDALICLTGAQFDASLDGAAIDSYAPVSVKAGQTLKIGRVKGGGLRGYLAVAGGFDAPLYLCSASCFTLGQFGGASGRAIAAGDLLFLKTPDAAQKSMVLQEGLRPAITKSWTIRVLAGPHAAPDFFTPESVARFLSEEWKVHYNSNRTGVRLIGPQPDWARRDGGEAGLHPSNIHDNAYAIGAIDFTGDMPVILGPDGPSLGGFVCPFAIIMADLWMMGQLAPGDTIRFELVDDEAATQAQLAADRFIETLEAPETIKPPANPSRSGILQETPQSAQAPRAIYRRQGDDNVLVEYGPIVLDLELRLRVHALMLEVQRSALPGVVELTPGIRSLQIHFDPRILPQKKLLEALREIETRLGDLHDFEVPSRIVHMPLSWDDPAIHETIQKYERSVRDDAPWTPSNMEFIRRINGLSSIEDVKQIVYGASYLVMGLGDVYLGAPVAVPVDPRHRLVTTKYNPARTWTPPNVVGIGGAYMCIYGMEGPGGYQLVGRTIQVWNSHRAHGHFQPGKPWLLRFFDQIRFFPVSHEELMEWRRDFPTGRRDVQIEETTFRLSDYRAFLQQNAETIAAFKTQREAAFAAERADWERRGEFERVAELLKDSGAQSEDVAVEAAVGETFVESPLGGSVWKIEAKVGQRVKEGERVAIVEAMKTECDVVSPCDGLVTRIFAQERQPIAAGAAMMGIGEG